MRPSNMQQGWPGSIGRFIVLDRVGSGGMGDVFSAYDPQLDRRVAVKVVRELIRTWLEARRAEAAPGLGAMLRAWRGRRRDARRRDD